MNNIEEHHLIDPKWVSEFLHGLAAHWAPEDICTSEIGYQLVEVERYSVLMVYPEPREVVGPCAADGSRVYQGFSLDVAAACEIFKEIWEVAWGNLLGYNGGIGSELRISGLFQNRQVILRVLQDPPSDAAASALLDAHTGTIIPNSS